MKVFGVGKVWVLGLIGAALLVGCPPSGDDDDDDTPSSTPATPTAGATDVPPTPTATATAEPTPTFGPVTVSGAIRAIDPATGEEIDEDTYNACFGAIAISFLEEPSDVQNPIDKVTLRSPGDFQRVFEPNLGQLYMSVVVDINNDQLIGYFDLYREYSANPLNIRGRDISGVDVVFELPPCGSGGGGCCGGGGGGGGTGGGSGEGYSIFSGTSVLANDELNSGPVAVTANDADYRGPYVVDKASEPGPFSIGIPFSYLDQTAFLAYLDVDNNGLFEPSDVLAQAPNNPYPLLEEPTRDITITFGETPFVFDDPPLPIYVPVSGEVVFDGEHLGLIYTYLSEDRPRGNIVSEAAQSLSGGFLLRAPQETENLWVWGVVDVNGDGFGDPATEPTGEVGPIRTTSAGVTGLNLALSMNPTPAPTPTPDEVEEPTEVPDVDVPTPTPDGDTPVEDEPTDAPVEGTEPPDAGDDTIPAEATPAPLSGGNGRIMGQVSFAGSFDAEDVLVVTLHPPEADGPGAPVAHQRFDMSGRTFPVDYWIDIGPGEYGVSAFLDISPEVADGPNDEDPTGFMSSGGGLPTLMTIEGGDTHSDANFSIE